MPLVSLTGRASGHSTCVVRWRPYLRTPQARGVDALCLFLLMCCVVLGVDERGSLTSHFAGGRWERTGFPLEWELLGR